MQGNYLVFSTKFLNSTLAHIDFCNLQINSSSPLKTYPSSCFTKMVSSRFPFRNAFLKSTWHIYKSFIATMANNILMEVNFTIGPNISLNFMPCFCCITFSHDSRLMVDNLSLSVFFSLEYPFVANGFTILWYLKKCVVFPNIYVLFSLKKIHFYASSLPKASARVFRSSKELAMFLNSSMVTKSSNFFGGLCSLIGLWRTCVGFVFLITWFSITTSN